jgi:hypothetical protein
MDNTKKNEYKACLECLKRRYGAATIDERTELAIMRLRHMQTSIENRFSVNLHDYNRASIISITLLSN